MLPSTDPGYHHPSEILILYPRSPDWTLRLLKPVRLNPILLRWLATFPRQDFPNGHSLLRQSLWLQLSLSRLTPILYQLVGGGPTCLGTKLKHIITTQIAK